MSIPSWVGWRLRKYEPYNPTRSGGTSTIDTNVDLGALGDAQYAYRMSNGQHYFPWEDAPGSGYTPIGTNFAIAARVKWIRFGDANAGWGMSDGLATGYPTVWVTLDSEGCLVLNFRYDDMGTPTTISVSSNYPMGIEFVPICIHRNGDNWAVYVDGDTNNPIVTTTVTSANLIGGLTGWHLTGTLFGQVSVDYMAFMDLDGAAPNTIHELVALRANGPVTQTVTANGNYTDWRNEAGSGPGDYTDIDEIPPSDANYIEASAATDQSTFVAKTCQYPHDHVAHDMKIIARVTRDNTDAGSNLAFMARVSATDATYTTQAAPADGYCWENVGPTAPDTNPWDPSSPGEIGAQAIT